jgi:hypothetical protein
MRQRTKKVKRATTPGAQAYWTSVEREAKTASVKIMWNGSQLQFSFEAKSWSEVQKLAAATIKRSGTVSLKRSRI